MNFFKLLFYTLIVFLQFLKSSPSQNDEEHGNMAISRQKTDIPTTIATTVTEGSSSLKWIRETHCPSSMECSKLGDPCISCTFNKTCVYGNITKALCSARVECIGKKDFELDTICRYCYQTEHWEHTCVLKSGCNSVNSPREYYRTNCTVRSHIQCLGKRTFYKNLKCNWTRGYRWSTALILSITLGGFGADRFYLGHWQEGIGKLFSFGGLGVWTLIDVVLIAIHYLGPADGSLYI
uniref:TM2 domain-containing protein n=1 Tax=Clastoptera arizonana TaxID=38151 RepID=A0A1B6CCP3_9HEMI